MYTWSSLVKSRVSLGVWKKILDRYPTWESAFDDLRPLIDHNGRLVGKTVAVRWLRNVVGTEAMTQTLLHWLVIFSLDGLPRTQADLDHLDGRL